VATTVSSLCWGAGSGGEKKRTGSSSLCFRMECNESEKGGCVGPCVKVGALDPACGGCVGPCSWWVRWTLLVVDASDPARDGCVGGCVGSCS